MKKSPKPYVRRRGKSQPRPPDTLPPNTTHEENIVTAGQRRVNIIWELTQTFIACTVIGCTLFVDVYVTVKALSNDLTVIQLVGVTNLTALAMLVVGFYFSRTNHSAIGGVGKKEPEGSLSRR